MNPKADKTFTKSGANRPPQTHSPEELRKVHHVMNVELPIGDPEVIAKRHEESKRRYPHVAIDDDEYVVVSVKRHPLGMFGIILMGMISFVLVASIWITICFMPNGLNLTQSAKNNLSLGAVAVLVLIAVFSYIGLMIYRRNQFIVTNERIIQKISTGLLDQQRQTINLEAIEDISYYQKGLMSHLFHYGTIRMSTVGDESTYTFTWVPQPHNYTDFLGDVVEDARENQFITDETMETGRKLSW
ncbi:MAG: PH domain-containing protein [Candidatus Sacchiramonaceae bacterium]|nr:PH domain-containing protein [Candidatus Saccharimonadaceae bacterium]